MLIHLSGINYLEKNSFGRTRPFCKLLCENWTQRYHKITIPAQHWFVHKELAKFGYKSERKIEKSKNHAIFWQPRTNFLNMAISKIFSLKSADFFGTFIFTISFVWATMDSFGHQVVKIRPKQNANSGDGK